MDRDPHPTRGLVELLQRPLRLLDLVHGQIHRPPATIGHNVPVTCGAGDTVTGWRPWVTLPATPTRGDTGKMNQNFGNWGRGGETIIWDGGRETPPLFWGQGTDPTRVTPWQERTGGGSATVGTPGIWESPVGTPTRVPPPSYLPASPTRARPLPTPPGRCGCAGIAGAAPGLGDADRGQDPPHFYGI